MADDADAAAAATATAVTKFLIKLKRVLPREEGEYLLCGLADKVRSLRDDLERIHQSFNGSFSQNRNWQARMVEEGLIHQIRDATFEAEDIIDKYLAIVAQRRGKSIWDRVKDKISQLLARRNVEEEIKGLRTRLQEIYKRQERIGIEITQQGDLPMMEGDDFSLRRRRRRTLLVEEIDVVGFDTDAKMIVERLTKGEARRDVIPIVGMGGIGKTTLARKVYNDAVVAEFFDFRAWARVSPDFIVRDLLQAIMNRAMRLTSKDMEEMSVDELGFELRKYLSSTRYLIVLDDVWSSVLWGELAPVFPNNMYGSRIILTTRQDKVALRVSPSSPPHRLRFLNEDESWDLFSRKVFPEGKCPSDLEELGKQMVYKCGGLPLAIVVLAGFLKKKEKTGRCWSEVSSSVSSFLTEHTDQCSKILELSYLYLPHHLKPCFLYFGLFPKHFEISARRLVCLWIAEGFLQEKDRETMEEVGEGYLEELIARNLVQISKRRFDGTVKTCCIDIHDLLQHFCLSKAKKEKFLEVLGDGRSSYSSSSSFPYNSRRLGLHSNVLKHICSNPSASKLHSVLFFSLDDRQLTSQEWKLLWKGFPLLRVLDLWVVAVEIIPNEIGKLIHLRFLRLKSLTARTLPASICNLWNLETLEVAAPCIDRPHIDIWKMKKLRHLNFHGQAVLPEPPKEEKLNNVLSNLLTLSSICPTSCSESVFSNLPNLIKLGIRGDLEAHMNLAFKYLPRLNCLLTLKLERDRRCKELTSLRNGIKFPPNLTKLTLLETQLLEDPMEVLGQLPNLQVLNLKNSAYSGSDLICPVNGFPKLQVLKLVNLAVRSWTISEGSMLSLKSVVINRCGQLRGLPPAQPSLPAFQKLELWWPNVSLVKEAREIEMSRGREQFKLVIYHS